MHFLGLAGMPRRIADYPAAYAGWNLVASFGSLITICSIVLFFYTIYEALVSGRHCERNRWSSEARIVVSVPHNVNGRVRNSVHHFVEIDDAAYRVLSGLNKDTKLDDSYDGAEEVFYNSTRLWAAKDQGSLKFLTGLLEVGAPDWSENSRKKNESPRPWQWAFQTPASAQMEGILDLYSDIMAILVGIAVFVFYILYVGITVWKWDKFNFVTSPEVRSFLVSRRPFAAYSHHTLLETI